MINHLTGTLEAVEKGTVVVDVGGVGFSVQMAADPDTLSRWSRQVGTAVKVYTHLAVREDDMSLYGFRSPQDRALFRLLLGVSGVGPKAATSVLSSLDAAALMTAILGENVNLLKKITGIGPKTAQRIVLELKDKVRKMGVVEGSMAERPEDRAIAEVVEVLESLGCAPDQADKVARQGLARLGPSAGFDTLLSACLKQLSEAR
ncbi:MAG TPA: Holliday junction branch migration protein RuvA [Candidatus Xenobia bacterium]